MIRSREGASGPATVGLAFLLAVSSARGEEEAETPRSSEERPEALTGQSGAESAPRGSASKDSSGKRSLEETRAESAPASEAQPRLGEVKDAPPKAADASRPADAPPKPADAPPKRADASKAPADAPKASSPASFADHFFSRIKVRGYTQFRFNHPTTNPNLVNLQGDRSIGGPSELFVRRARLVLYGDIHPLIYIYLQPDFATTTDDGLHFIQWRDWYFDLSAPGKEFRLRIGQSKIPFGFENLQSSGNRLPFDRSDALNSAVTNERDLGLFLYWAPIAIRERFDHLVKSGLKGSGDYGAVGLGLYNGQGSNKADLNDNKHVVGRVSYPFLFGEQFVEIGGGGYVGRFIVNKDETVDGPDESWDARGNLALTIYPQPFGFQAEYNIGVSPELTDIREDSSGPEPVFSGTVREKLLHGGYAMLSFKVDHTVLGTFMPYVRGHYYEGARKFETNAPHYSVRELEVGFEWQPVRMLEFTAAFAAAERTAPSFPYQQEEAQFGRFQLQMNY